jgi:hypothetical protein
MFSCQYKLYSKIRVNIYVYLKFWCLVSYIYDKNEGDKTFAVKKPSVSTDGEPTFGDKIGPPNTDGDKISGLSTNGLNITGLRAYGLTMFGDSTYGVKTKGASANGDRI